MIDEADAYAAEIAWYEGLRASPWFASLDGESRRVFDWALESAVLTARRASEKGDALMTALLPCVEVGPRGQAAGAVVWLHGLGANGHDFEPIVPYLELPRVRFVFPHAPLRAVTINGGMEMPAWYDILTLGRAGGREPRARARGAGPGGRAAAAREGARHRSGPDRARRVQPGRARWPSTPGPVTRRPSAASWC